MCDDEEERESREIWIYGYIIYIYIGSYYTQNFIDVFTCAPAAVSRVNLGRRRRRKQTP
jgi:hypothetical protein